MKPPTEVDFCRKLALGSLLQGHFHNLRGIVQKLSLRVETLLYTAPEDIKKDLQALLNTVFSLENYIESAISSVINDNPGPWNLKQLLSQELTFWQGDLNFKHNIKKELVAKEEVWVSAPYFLVRGILCWICQELIPRLKKGDVLRIEIKNGGVNFSWQTPLDSKFFELVKAFNQSTKNIEVTFGKNELFLKFLNGS